MTLPPLRLDRTRMVQVLGNILRNACESFDSAAADDGARRLDISAEQTEIGRLCLTVTDNGAGFLPEQAETLLDRGTSTKSRGTGLGLDICRAIVESHGGHMRIESEGIGKGATVSIDLPTDPGED